MIVYHGSGETVEYPEIRRSRFTKDFSWGFYCTTNKEQAKKWTQKWLISNKVPTLNYYNYQPNPELRVLKFETMTDEWLDFIADCRSGKVHDYDIVEGPMADDVVWTYVNDYLSGKIHRETFFSYAKFNRATHQISFHSLRALSCLEFERSEPIKW